MPKKQFKEGETPRVSVLERRLQNPFGEPSVNIRFKDKNITARWFNDDARHGQVHRGRELGWQDVTLDMIADKESLGFHTINPEGRITRGPRGQEVLLWMRTEDFKQIQWAKTKENLKTMNDFDREKQAIVNAAAEELGDEAADYLHRNVSGGSGYVHDQVERVERIPE